MEDRPVQSDLLLQIYGKVEVLISEQRETKDHVEELTVHVKATNGRLSTMELQEAETRGGVKMLKYLVGIGIAVAGLVLTAVGILTTAIIVAGRT